MIPKFIDKSKIPHQPGIYVYKDQDGRVLYVGKAIDLYHRVSSYFSGTSPKGVYVAHPKGGLVEQIRGVETIITEGELEALILEANLIKKYLPLFNIKLTDSKDYLYIAITKEDFPKIVTARRKGLKITKKYWGPFPSSRTVRNTLKSLRRVFPWCSNPLVLRSQASPGRLERKARACFYYHLGLCPGACLGLISQKDYHKIINRFAKFLDGRKEDLVKELTAEMTGYAQKQEFEKASEVKKTLEGITYLTQPNRTSLYLENPNFLEEETKLALKKLQEDLSLSKLPQRIEGYDISNISGKEAVGSMVVLTDGEIDKSQYRKFKISPPAGPAAGGAGGSDKPDDVGMMAEMIKRRFKHAEWPMPDLILIDGGRGQARAAKLEIAGPRRGGKLDIPAYGLAKRMEWLYPPEGEIVKLSKHSLSLKLLQKLRDEAHRFALSYHRKLHRKSILGSEISISQ